MGWLPELVCKKSEGSSSKITTITLMFYCHICQCVDYNYSIHTIRLSKVGI